MIKGNSIISAPGYGANAIDALIADGVAATREAAADFLLTPSAERELWLSSRHVEISEVGRVVARTYKFDS